MAEGASAKGKTFSPVPARVMAEEGLSALDLRVLAAIAAHDRFGANGIGCYASHPRLAALVGCNPKSLSRSLRRLAELGYLEAAPHPMNRRLRVYRVIYNAEDKAAMQARIGNETVTDEAPETVNRGTGFSAETPNAGSGIGNRPVPDDPPIGNRDFQEAERFQEDADVNIFSEAVRTSGETLNESSSEEAPPYGDAPAMRNEGQGRQELATYLRKLEAWAKGLNGNRLSPDQVADLRNAREFCEQVEADLAYDDDEAASNLGFQAQRLAILISDRFDL